jgi:hypothetical protein
MNTSRFPRTMREAWGHHTGDRFDEEMPRPSRLWLVLPVVFLALLIGSL